MSDRSRTSVRKCETRMTVWPWARRPRMIWCSRSTSTVDRLADGSSRTISSASRASARRISTCCWAAMGRCPTTDPASRSKPASATSRSNRSRSDRRSMKPARFGSAPRNTFSATVSLGTRATSCATSAIPRTSAARGEPNATGVPCRTRSPWSCGNTPAMILPRVDLPAPFSPTKAWTVPCRMAIETSSRARVAPKDFPSPRTSRWTTSSACIVVSRPATRSDVSPATPRAAGRSGRWPWSPRRRRAASRADRHPGPACRTGWHRSGSWCRGRPRSPASA